MTRFRTTRCAARRHLQGLVPFVLCCVLAGVRCGGQTTIWTATGSGDFGTAANWGGGTSPGEPTTGTDALIENGTASNPTSVSIAPGENVSLRNLTLVANNSLAVSLNSSLTIYGTSVANNGTLSVTAGSANNTNLLLANNVTLTGTGVVTLSYGDHNGNDFVEQSGGNYTLTNQSNTIQGDGIIGNGALTFANASGGTVAANVSGSILTLNGTGGITNAGLLEATGGGILQVASSVANTGGTITASGGTVQLSSSIVGGTLTTSAGGLIETSGSDTLNSLTISAGSTYTGPLNTTTNVGGTLTNNGTLQLNAGSANNTFFDLISDVSLQGAGTLNLNSGDDNGLVYVQQSGGSYTLTNLNNTIQGYGIIGNGGLTVVNAAAGIVDSNVSGQVLTLNGTGGVTNTGLMEATNGGTLQLTTPVNNLNGSIVAATGTVNFSAAVAGGTLSGGSLRTNGSATLDGLSQGVITLAAGSNYLGNLNTTTTLLGTINNLGTLQLVAGSANNTNLDFASDLTLEGGGTVTLNSGDTNGLVYLQPYGGNFVFTNVDNLIEGYGVIGNGGLTFVNQAAGVVNANVTGRTITLNGTGGVTNAGILEATGGGILQLSTPVVNANAVIYASTGSVNVSTTITGGNLTGGSFQTNGSATLDGETEGALTLTSASTYSGGLNTNTYLLGAITNNGLLKLTAGSANNTFLFIASNVTLQGGGTVTLNSGDTNGLAYVQQYGGSFTLTNVDNLIQGYGAIGNGGLAFVNSASGEVLANSPNGRLILNGSGNVVNNGLLEASGGTLQITNVVSNASGTIESNAGQVLIDGGATIQGGTLAALNGGTFVNDGGDTLDGTGSALTIAANTTFSGNLGTTTNLLGTINNLGTLYFVAGSANNTGVNIASNVTLQGGGAFQLNSGDTNGEVFVQQSGGNYTLTNVDNLIEGYGVIGNGGLTFVNGAAGVVNANVSGQTIYLNGSGGVTNAGILEATAGASLQISTTINNASGTINASDGTVRVSGTVQGGIMSGTGFQTNGTGTLDGSTQGALTLATGSLYSGNLGTFTYLTGTLVNQGTLQFIAGSANNTTVNIAGNVTLQGGGTVNLNSGDDNGLVYVQQSASGLLLTNVDNQIQGYGVLGNGGLSFLNQLSGIVDANVPGQLLQLNGLGSVTNNGTFEANGGTLALISAPTNFSGNVLTGGTWEATGSGTVRFDGTANAIVTNDATLVLDGLGSAIETRTSPTGGYQQVEQTLTTNGGALEVTGGCNFSASNPIANSGVIQLGGGTFTAPGLSNSSGAVLSGFGTFSPTGGVSIAQGVSVSPGSAINGQRIGALSFGTPLVFGPGGSYVFSLQDAGSVTAGGTFDTVSVAGTLTVTATSSNPFAVSVETVNPTTGALGLANFSATQAYSWTVLTAGSIVGFSPGAFSVSTGSFQNPLAGGTFAVGETGNSLTLNFTPVPEPETWVLLLVGLLAVAAIGARRLRPSS